MYPLPYKRFFDPTIWVEKTRREKVNTDLLREDLADLFDLGKRIEFERDKLVVRFDALDRRRIEVIEMRDLRSRWRVANRMQSLLNLIVEANSILSIIDEIRSDETEYDLADEAMRLHFLTIAEITLSMLIDPPPYDSILAKRKFEQDWILDLQNVENIINTPLYN